MGLGLTHSDEQRVQGEHIALHAVAEPGIIQNVRSVHG